MCLQPCRFGSAESNSISSSRRTGACISAVHSLIEPLPEEIGSENSPKLIYPLQKKKKKCQEIYMTNECLQRELMQTPRTSLQCGSPPLPTPAWKEVQNNPNQWAGGTWGTPMGTWGHESFRDGQRCKDIAATQQQAPFCRLGAGCTCTEHLGGAWRDAAGPSSSVGPWGRAGSCCASPHLPDTVVWGRAGSWRLLGLWLACVMGPGRRCHNPICFNGAAAAPR